MLSDNLMDILGEMKTNPKPGDLVAAAAVTELVGQFLLAGSEDIYDLSARIDQAIHRLQVFKTNASMSTCRLSKAS